MFGFRPDYDKRLAFPLFEAIFEVNPDRDFCVITMPFMSMGFEQIKYFVKLIPKLLNNFERELFVMYKYSVIGPICVQITENEDLKLIEVFLSAMPQCNIIMNDIAVAVEEYNQSKTSFPILIRSCDVIVGIFVAK